MKETMEEMTVVPSGFLEALVSETPAPELEHADMMFGFLIGSWDIQADLRNASAESRTIRGELHAAWVLEGRAIQDLFIFRDALSV